MPPTSTNFISVDGAGATRMSMRVRPARFEPNIEAIRSLIESSVGI